MHIHTQSRVVGRMRSAPSRLAQCRYLGSDGTAGSGFAHIRGVSYADQAISTDHGKIAFFFKSGASKIFLFPNYAEPTKFYGVDVFVDGAVSD